MASFFVEVRVPFFRTLMQISLSLHRVPAFREGDKAEREGRQYLSASSLLPWPSAANHEVRPSTFGLRVSKYAQVNRLSKREPFFCVFPVCSSSCLLFLLFSALNRGIRLELYGYNRAGFCVNQTSFVFCQRADLLEARLKYLVRRGTWYLIIPSFVAFIPNSKRKTDQSTSYWVEVIPSR